MWWGRSWRRLRDHLRWTQGRLENAGDREGDRLRPRLGQVGQRDHREVLLGIALDAGLESLPRPGVADAGKAALLIERPAEAVGVSPTVVEPHRSPALPKAVGAGVAKVVESHRPARQVQHGEIQRAVGGGVELRRHPLLVLQPPLDQPVAVRAVGHDVAFRDDSGGAHAQRLEYLRPQQIAVEGARDPVDDDAEQDVAGVAVAPARAGLEQRVQPRGEADQVVFAVVPPVVQRAVGVVGET